MRVAGERQGNDMKSGTWWRRAVAVGSAAALMSLGAAGLMADDGSGGTGRAVRLSSVEGQVQVAQGGDVLADHALANTPLFDGAQVSTGDDGRAEIQFDDGSVVRIPPDSSLTLNVLKPGETEIGLDNGMGYFELQDGNQSNPMRVRFGGSLVTVSGFTVLRVRLDEGPGELAVFSGNAHIDGTNGASLDVKGGESVALNNLSLSENIEPDSWDAWNSDRDQAMTTADAGSTPATSGVANSENPAWSDLNSSGTWYDVPDQGYVWSPYEAANGGWDPYGAGSWMWTPAYGYMWVSGYSWGYMPYQCGAWNWYNSFGWGWAPGMCNTWWGGGGWIFNVGRLPVWYRLPIRPRAPRPQPLPVTGRPGVRLPIGMRPVVPIITVKRTEPTDLGDLPPRAVGHPIQIGGVVAQPLKPTAPREGFHRPITAGPVTTNPVRTFNPGGGATGRPVQPGSPRQGYVPAPVPRPGYQPMQPVPQPGGGRAPAPAPPVYHPAPAPVYRPAPAPSPAPRPSGGGSAPRSAPAPHPSGGGGGSHPTGTPK
jgi:FecR protein